MENSVKQRAIAKTKLEIGKDVSRLIDVAKQCGYGELRYFLHFLHFLRLIPGSGAVSADNQTAIGLYVNLSNDAIKYLIQLITKHCQPRFIKSSRDGSMINLKMVEWITKVALSVNSKFESLTFLTMFNTSIQVSGERDQYIKMNMDELLTDDRMKKFLYYGVRTDMDGDFQKKDSKQKDDFIEHFRNEYSPYSDLFAIAFGVTVEEFIELINWTLETIILRSNANEKHYAHLKNGNINIQDYQTIMRFGSSMFLKKSFIYEKFGRKYDKVVAKLTFQPSEFDEHQLRYNLIARQPIISKGDLFIISPEILLDSLFVNSHYSFLETTEIKEDYKHRYAKRFVDKIVSIAETKGFREVARDFELREKKQPIGDLDVILKNDYDEFLLVEAKNHALPLDVYFHDQEATEKRLTQLQNEWEKKVAKRQKHMELHHNEYGISSSFNYIIVTKAPEVLSHFSDFLVLSLDEFKHWINMENTNSPFESLFENVYNLNEPHFSEKQLRVMEKDLFSAWRFEKE